jgi:hypothetical protein
MSDEQNRRDVVRQADVLALSDLDVEVACVVAVHLVNAFAAIAVVEEAGWTPFRVGARETFA